MGKLLILALKKPHWSCNFLFLHSPNLSESLIQFLLSFYSLSESDRWIPAETSLPLTLQCSHLNVFFFFLTVNEVLIAYCSFIHSFLLPGFGMRLRHAFISFTSFWFHHNALICCVSLKIISLKAESSN